MIATTETAPSADVKFYFDPVCPFAWMTSKWLRMVAAQRNYRVEWKFISLRLVNAAVDCDSHFPPGYEVGHTVEIHLLRVAARTRVEHGPDAVGNLYQTMGTRIFDTNNEDDTSDRGSAGFVEPILDEVGLPAELAAALDGTSLDPMLRAETDEALGLTGSDVGTPIIHFQPPTGVAFFGPLSAACPTTTTPPARGTTSSA
jgi:hypothetical protein